MKPSIPKGTRDFSATEIAKRNYIFDSIKNAFQKFGFEPIETPSFEKSETLMGKYGEEGDRLIFKILNSGEKVKNADITALANNKFSKFSNSISEKALRYDLTVPFARYVVQHQNDIIFPFKRYQIQPVWRADRPQKGRFREFYQCDADVIGSTSLLQEVELVQLYDNVFSKLELIGTTIKINNRKILSGIAEIIGAADQLIDFTVALDKLDKIGEEGVRKEMISKGISEIALAKLQPLFNLSGSNQEILNQLQSLLNTSEVGMKGIEEVQYIINAIEEIGLQTACLEIDITLARGLNYYTGAIFEVAAPKEVKMGSIGGGGRYDDLTGVFGLNDLSGVGISFGLDRIYLVLEELELLKEVEIPQPKVVFLNFQHTNELSCLKAIKELRANNITCELYADKALSNKQEKKQWKYVSIRRISYVITNNEKDFYTLKDTNTGEQSQLSISQLINELS